MISRMIGTSVFSDGTEFSVTTGARPEVTRDNMGHANIDVTQNVYGRSWWEERVEAVTRTVDAVFCQLEPQLESPDSPAVPSN
jgi:hypothetical protein